MNNIELCITPQLIGNYSLENKTVVVVDILRATTIITTLFENGLEKLIPARTLEEAQKYKDEGYLVAAERNGEKLDFADFGNSPFEFVPDKIKGKTLVYSTTNGTNTINTVKNANEVIIASFLNFSTVVRYLTNNDKDVLILCSGWMQDYCAEDFLFAGALAQELINSGKFSFESDSVQSSIDIWNIANENLDNYITKLFQYKRLVQFGFKEIVEYCFRTDLSKALPMIEKEYIINCNKIS